jgi:signal transduction histidine kinase
MHYYFTVVSLIAGICLGFGILFLFIGLRRKDNKPLNLTFAVFALCYAITLFNGIRWYSTDNINEFIAINRFDSVFVAGAFVALVLYISYYTSFRPRIFLWVLSAAFIVPSLVFIISPETFTGEFSGLTHIVLPWGEKLADLDSAGSIWFDIFTLASLVTLGFIIFALIRQFLRGERQPAIILGLGMLPFIAGIIYEALGESGVVPYIPFGELGFLGIAIAASLQMANSVIKTEEALARHRQGLETLVGARTAELETANEQLAQEIVERKRTADLLRRRADELAVLNRISHTLTTAADLPAALGQVSQTVSDLFDARYTHIALTSDEETRLIILVGHEREVGTIGRTPVDIPSSELPRVRQVLDEGQSLALSDLQSQALASRVHEIIAARDLQSAVLVPLLARGGTVGLMSVASDQPTRAFSPDEVSLAETIAADIAGAIENARLLEQAKASAAAGERNRIARELHDSVTQTLYSVSIVAEALPRLLERDLETAKRNAAYLRQTTLGALAEMRTLLFELRPGTLEKANLDVLLQQLADVLTGRTRVPVDVTVEGQAKLPPEVKIVFYRIAQEAFNNIIRHANATHAWATLRRGSDMAILVVRDNGKGFDPQSIPGERMGLRIMHERAAEMGACLKVQSEHKKGTQITVEWARDERRMTEDEGLATERKDA